jgi:uncharacterized phage-associated protein
MAARLDSVAKFICDEGNWTVTNLQLQKMMYLAQMLYMGVSEDNERLFDGTFEAWDYGPVEPTLYHRVKQFGAQPIADNVFFAARNFSPESSRLAFLKEEVPALLKYTPRELVEITHWDGGAWFKFYEQQARHTRIPDSAILDEYKARTGPTPGNN